MVAIGVPSTLDCLESGKLYRLAHEGGIYWGWFRGWARIDMGLGTTSLRLRFTGFCYPFTERWICPEKVADSIRQVPVKITPPNVEPTAANRVESGYSFPGSNGEAER
jgi:hypothetical protein